MLFHVGAIWRLLHAGLLPSIKRISSVSGGSITAAKLGLHWNELRAAGFNEAVFVEKVVDPIRDLGATGIDVSAILGGVLWFGTVSDRVTDAYRDHLFGEATLQDLPSDDEGPRFVINATNVQTMALWRFMKPYMSDYRVGSFKKPEIELAVAVAASSAFPPVLSPLEFHPDPSTFDESTKGPLGVHPYTTHVVLSDGGVYDNLGLETAWKRYRTILVSDGGGKASEQKQPKRDWALHSLRVFEIVDNQVRSLRKRQVIDSILNGQRYGAYWGIRDNVTTHGANPKLSCPFDRTTELAHIGTRLDKLDESRQNRLINWGYADCDASLVRWLKKDPQSSFDPRVTFADQFPCPGGV